MAMITVLRQLPRKSRILKPISAAAITIRVQCRVLGVSVSGCAARYCRSQDRIRQFRPVDQGLACEDSAPLA
jgi:hypothetical protein